MRRRRKMWDVRPRCHKENDRGGDINDNIQVKKGDQHGEGG